MIQLIIGTKATRTKQDPCPFCPNFSIKNFIVMIVWFPVIKELFENVVFCFYFLFCNNYRITSCAKCMEVLGTRIQFLPMITSHITIVQYQNGGVNMSIIHGVYSDFQYYVQWFVCFYVCLCIVLCDFITCGWWWFKDAEWGLPWWSSG